MINLAEGLAAEGAEVVQLMVETPGNPFPEMVPEQYPFKWHRVFLDTRVKWLEALLNLFSSGSYHLSRFRQAGFRKKLLEVLQSDSFDIIQAESPYVLVFLEEIRKYSNARVVLRAHNVEHLIWERVSKSAKRSLKGFYLQMQSKRLRREESMIAKNADGLVVMSADDLQFFREMGVQTAACIVGIGSRLQPPEKVMDQTGNQRIFHLGAMNWFPNQEGIRWFLKEVWPLLRQELPGLSLHLAGIGMPSDIRSVEKEGIVVEEAPDTVSYMLEHGVMVVPLLSGSGIRVKIIEGLKLGKVIVATNIAVEGLGVVDGRDILIADDPHEFVKKIVQCFHEPELAGKISENALTFAAEHFDTARLAKKLLRFYQSLAGV
jgi:glycosyltransferase involved in cell wall biosynthesis